MNDNDLQYFKKKRHIGNSLLVNILT